MRSFLSILCLALLFQNCSPKADSKNDETMEVKQSKATDPVLRHVVLFKFKDGTAESDLENVEKAFIDLPNHIKEIKGFEWGLNNSPEGLNQEFTHCFFLSFDSEEDRATYLPHPKHKEFGDILTPHLDKVLVVDYWTK